MSIIHRKSVTFSQQQVTALAKGKTLDENGRTACTAVQYLCIRSGIFFSRKFLF
ncbi:MAG: hypothetical protein HUJ54_02930 [Erysipelotrichaceae bacterium]|nr:hypothetical protein [Erysipelotrichaceae bacterium]